jgi:hypothetical protein
LHNLQTVASFDERYVGKYSSIVWFLKYFSNKGRVDFQSQSWCGNRRRLSRTQSDLEQSGQSQWQVRSISNWKEGVLPNAVLQLH